MLVIGGGATTTAARGGISQHPPKAPVARKDSFTVIFTPGRRDRPSPRLRRSRPGGDVLLGTSAPEFLQTSSQSAYTFPRTQSQVVLRALGLRRFAVPSPRHRPLHRRKANAAGSTSGLVNGLQSTNFGDCYSCGSACILSVLFICSFPLGPAQLIPNQAHPKIQLICGPI